MVKLGPMVQTSFRPSRVTFLVPQLKDHRFEASPASKNKSSSSYKKQDSPPTLPRRVRRIPRPPPLLPAGNGMADRNQRPSIQAASANLGYLWGGFSKRKLTVTGGVEDFVASNPSLATFGGDHGLERLQRLSCRLDPNQATTSTATWQRLFEALPNLKILHLEVRCHLDGAWEDEQLRQLLPALEHEACAFSGTLTTLHLPFSCNKYQDAVHEKAQHTALAQRLVLETLPKFPNLRTLSVTPGLLGTPELLAVATALTKMEEQNEIMSELFPSSSRSRTARNPNLFCIQNHGFSLDGPVGSTWRKQHKVSTTDLRTALLVVLRAFPGLYDLSGKILYKYRPGLLIRLIRKDMPPPHERFLDIETRLLLNYAGRYRFGGASIAGSIRRESTGDDPGGVNESFDLSFDGDFNMDAAGDREEEAIPPSLWPRILERAHQGSWRVYGRPSKMSRAAKNALRDATGLYDLLRNCQPILEHLAVVQPAPV